jgi:hypothetical protein
LFQQLLPLLPSEPGTLALVVASIGTLVGAGMWLAGAKFSRPVLTLTAVALGTAVGNKLPLWCGWSIDGMGPAVGGAVVLGITAFAFHRAWVGLWLGALLACWTALAVWLLLGNQSHWTWPAMNASTTLPKYFSMIWLSLPENVTRVLPFFCGIAMLGGWAAGVLWPRVGLVLMWSAGGISIAIGMGAVAMQRIHPSALAHLPKQTWTQLALLVVLITAGAIWQWRITNTPAENKETVEPNKIKM